VKEIPPRHSTTQSVIGIYFLRADPKISIYSVSWLKHFDTATNFVSLDRQLKIRVALSLAVQG